MPLRLSTRPRDARGRRSSAFIHKDVTDDAGAPHPQLRRSRLLACLSCRARRRAMKRVAGAVLVAVAAGVAGGVALLGDDGYQGRARAESGPSSVGATKITSATTSPTTTGPNLAPTAPSITAPTPGAPPGEQ